jgi:hypothetical protein
MAISEFSSSEKSYRLIQRTQRWIVALSLFLVLAPILAGWYFNRTIVQVENLKISNITLLSQETLCPGDYLAFEYDFSAKGAGKLVRDYTTWQVSPPITVIFSEEREFILPGPVEQHLVERWPIPSGYYSYAVGRVVPFAPGEYKRMISISSPTRSTIAVVDSVTFFIGADCP